jgi:hypothetical protein
LRTGDVEGLRKQADRFFLPPFTDQASDLQDEGTPVVLPQASDTVQQVAQLAADPRECLRELAQDVDAARCRVDAGGALPQLPEMLQNDLLILSVDGGKTLASRLLCVSQLSVGDALPEDVGGVGIDRHNVLLRW